jgi:hypothetical protein
LPTKFSKKNIDMATASDLKAKVTKISTIVEYLEDEQISQIEKDILLQAVRELYSDILVTKVGDYAEEKVAAEEEKEVVEETPVQEEEKPTEPPVVAIPFDAGDFDFHDLLDVNNEAEQVEEPVAEEPSQSEIPEEVAEEPVPEVVEEPAEMEVQEEVVEPQEEPVEEEESKLETEYFAQSESVSSDFDEAVSSAEEIEDVVSEENTEPEVVAEVEEQVVEDQVVEEQPAEVVEDPVIEEFAKPIEPVADEQPEEIPAPQVVEKITLVEPIHQEPEPEKIITLGEQLGQSRQESLNDKFANNKSADLSSSIGLKPISDIKSSIPLGERFLFTRTLFSGSGALFESTVAALNGMSSMEEAEGYIRANFNWDMESSTVANFMNIVRRRYL